MAGSSYRQLHTVDDDFTELRPDNISTETIQGQVYNVETIFSDIQDQAGHHCHGSCNSESTPTPQINIIADETHPSRRLDTAQHDTALLSSPEISNSSTSVETRDNEPGNGFQRPTMDQSAECLHPTWTDFYLRPVFLISLSVFLTSIIAVLEVLHYISQHDQGLVTASEDMHYIWTYGPTFGKQPARLGSMRWTLLTRYIVLTMIAALWGQLEQRAKQIMPWCLMSRGEAPAQNSLMLNYVTSSTLGSLFRSLRKKHLLVSIGICGSLILRLIIVFASGLLRLEYRSVVLERTLIVEDIFDLMKNTESWDTIFPVTNGLKYWAILRYGLPYPHGTTSELAVQSFITGDDSKFRFGRKKKKKKKKKRH